MSSVVMSEMVDSIDSLFDINVVVLVGDEVIEFEKHYREFTECYDDHIDEEWLTYTLNLLKKHPDSLEIHFDDGTCNFRIIRV